MRPQAIRNFERLSLLAVAIAAIVLLLNWNLFVAAVRMRVLGTGIEAGLIVLSLLYLGLLVLLILLISRRASLVAKWILVLIIALELVYTVPAIPGMLRAGPIGWAETVQLLIQLAAIVLLFTPAARTWFREARTGGLSA
jgi:hypothetical protein